MPPADRTPTSRLRGRETATVLAVSVHDNAAGIALLDQVAVAAGGSLSEALADQGFKNQVVTHRAALGIDVEIVGSGSAAIVRG